MIRFAQLLLAGTMLVPAPALAAEVLADVPADAAFDADPSGTVIVVTGTADGYRPVDANAIKTPTPLVDVPQTITVLTREQLDDQAITQLGDALRYVPGVVLGQGEGHRDQITLRGQSTTADFYLDGLRDDTQYYRSLYNIERVEVLKGANALLFGRGGGGGVINRVSKTPDLGRTKGGADINVDSFGAFALAADLNQPLTEQVAGRLNATYEEFDNHRQNFEGRFIGVNPTLAFEPGDATRIELSYNYDDDRRTTDRGVPSLGGKPLTGYDDTFFGTEALNLATVKAHIAQARVDHDLADNLSFNVLGQYTHTDKLYGNVFASGAVNTATNTVPLTGYQSGNVRDSWVGQANLVWTGSTGGIGHTLLAGVEAANQDTLSTRRNSNNATVALAERIVMPAFAFGALVTNSKTDVRTLSAYVQDQVELAPFLQLVAGVRFDEFRISGRNAINGVAAQRTDRKWSPRFGVVLKPRKEMSFYGSFTRSFLPQSGDQFGALDATQATLAPEQFENLEAGMKWDITPALAFTAAAYRLERDNSRFNNPVTGLPELSGKTRTKGIELSLAGRVLPDLQMSVGYTLQEGEVRSSTTAAPAGRKLAQLPRHQFAAWSRYDITKQIGVGLGVTHQSKSFTTISNAVTLPAFTRVDAAVFYDISDRFSVQLNVENLTDTDYFPSAHTDNNISTGEPINARVSIKAKF
ncbi:TonB-dependent siderophore receptor [Novosphingobium sp. MMS21-SN21R]|uniref:TonB-dependent receptor n=1 Tax=Novosphingobium sp. MMS21-SN21R TaxID=2969298 RepID=UPI0028860A19|nr:TonB-dependent siderophore receptor [Novosphingobium sp. MMS21-SN21R]MDT0509416.1 TonB-dependent siderophore receptor [Novosphingobium sp. MMS21-SN21R]